MMAVLFYLFSLCVWLNPDQNYSMTERRKLAQLPTANANNIFSGKYMTDFEKYALDQFPFRDGLRSLKAVTSLKKDNNGLYLANGHISSMEYPLNQDSLTHASKVFQNICQKYLKDHEGRIYLSIIPDKNYFLAEENGYLELDYAAFVKEVCRQNANMQYIDIFPLLSEGDYYRTDIHWKQECIVDAADELLVKMGNAAEQREYVKKETKQDFYGVYYGQSALPVKPDKISYLTNDSIENFLVYDYENNCEIPVYDIRKLTGNDPYELFLGGSLSLLTIENKYADTKKELIIFRDSFGSSIAPLLAQGYAKTTWIDVRYIQSAMLGEYVDFENADILFLYSVPVLNHSETLK